MNSIRRIVVAIKDPQARSQPALMKAAQLAAHLGARLELFHALTEPLYPGPYPDPSGALLDLEQRVKTSVLRRLEQLAQRVERVFRRRKLRVAASVLWDAPAYDAVIRRARALKAQLIVAEAHHGRRFLPLLHFNDWELLRRSPLPVLLVKRPGLYLHPTVLAAVDPPLGRAARLDDRILRHSQTLAQALHGHLECVHAYTPVPDGRSPLHALDVATARSVNEKMAASARRRYDALLRGFRVARARRHLLAMPPAAAIASTARATGSAIVTLGILSRHGWQRLLIGHTAETLLDRLACDLLVVKPSGLKTTMAKRPAGARYMVAVATP